MVNVLHVYPRFGNAGTEMVITNLMSAMDSNFVHFDFCAMCEGSKDTYFREQGSKVFYVPNSKKYEQSLAEFFRSHPEYRIIHTHTHKEMGIVLKAAARAGVPIRIAHSHNSRADLPKWIKVYKYFTSRGIEKYATHFIACSSDAAAWLFPRNKDKCAIWKNGISIERFAFNDEARTRIRAQYGIKDEDRVICHIGRFARQKNHEFIVDILNELIKADPSVHAFLVGNGPIENEIKGKAKYDDIHFLGSRNDVPDILSASDLFFFPSLWEGLGIVAVEAQVSGLQCLASDMVPKEADVGLGLFKRIKLSEPQSNWIDEIKKRLEAKVDRKKIAADAVQSAYNIDSVARNAQKFYLECERDK